MKRDIVIYLGAMVMPDGNAGAQRTVSLCKSLIDIGYKPVVIGLSKDDSIQKNIINTKRCYQSIEYFEIKYPHSIIEWIRRMCKIRQFIDVIKYYGINRIHSIIAIDYEMIALYRLKHFCEKNEIYLIADSMEWYEKSALSFPMNIVKDIDTYVRMKFLYKKIPNAICISKYLYDYHKKINPDKNAAIIPVTVDKTDKKWTNKYYGKTSGIKTLVYAGNPGEAFIKERLDWLVNIVLELNRKGKSCRLKVIGVNQEWFIAQLKNKLSSENKELMAKYVIFMGQIGHRECLEEIKKSDFFTIAREDRLVTRAGFPTKLSEGLACGIPVITTPSSDIGHYLHNKKFAFITKDFTFESFYSEVERAVDLEEHYLCELKRDAAQYNGLEYHSFSEKLAIFMDGLKS